MKILTKGLMIASLGLTITSTFAQNVGVPPVVSLYAENLVYIEICKKANITISPMDQRKVIRDYIQQKGSQDGFVDSVRQYTGIHMGLLSSLPKDKQLELCSAQARIDKEIASILAPKKPEEKVNPLDKN